MKPTPVIQLIQQVSEYHAVFGDPLPYKAVSAKFHRRLELNEVLPQLQREGILSIHLNRRGGKALTLNHLDYSQSKALKGYELIPVPKP